MTGVEFLEGDLARPRRGQVAPCRAWTTCCTRRRFPRCRARWKIPSRRIARTSTPRSMSWSPRAMPASSAWCMPARRRRTATRRRCRSTRTCPRIRSRPTRCRSWWASSTCRCSPALYGLETVTIRYFNVFGPRQDPSSPYSGVISVFAKALLENRAPTIHGDGEQTRDFTYVANVVDGVLRAVTAPGASGAVVNVATGSRISLNRLFEVMRALIGQPGRRGLRAATRRGRQGFAGRHHESPDAARLPAARFIRRRSPAHRRVVSIGSGRQLVHFRSRAITPSLRLSPRGRHGGSTRKTIHSAPAGALVARGPIG